MDYLQRDAYFTGVSYGHFDMERILRVMRPREDQVVIKKSGMHAVEDYIMSRYQMYWQVYFHPVSRSAEVTTRKILQRVKVLYENSYEFKHEPIHFLSFSSRGQPTLENYLKLDEAIVSLFTSKLWQEEDDQILKDLSRRFLNRFTYLNTSNPDPAKEYKNVYGTCSCLFKMAGIDPDYYLVLDSSSRFS